MIDYRISTLVNAAHPGDLLFIWGTGLGPIKTSDAGAPPVGNLDVPVEVYVGNVKAAVSYQGRSGCCAGIDQILFTVPSGFQGCYVPVVVKSGNMVSIVGLRDRALIGVMVYSFARVSATVHMRVEDHYQNGKRWWFRLHEKGGKLHDVPPRQGGERAAFVHFRW